jgi:hypothetical protein
MRISVYLAALVVVLTVGGCAEEPRSVSLPRPGPAAIPPPPTHPKIEGRVKSVSSADICEVIRLKQQDMVKEYGRILPIYTVRVYSKNHIEVQFWGADGIEYWRDARRVKGKWKFDDLVPVILAADLTNRCSQPLTVLMRRFNFMKQFSIFAAIAAASAGSAPSR